MPCYNCFCVIMADLPRCPVCGVDRKGYLVLSVHEYRADYIGTPGMVMVWRVEGSPVGNLAFIGLN